MSARRHQQWLEDKALYDAEQRIAYYASKERHARYILPWFFGTSIVAGILWVLFLSAARKGWSGPYMNCLFGSAIISALTWCVQAMIVCQCEF